MMNTNRKSTTKNSKGLQKLTELEIKMNSLLSLEKITRADTDPLNEEERAELSRILTHQLSILKGAEKEKLYNQVEGIMDSQTKNEIWENNQINIMWAISSFIRENSRMPTKTEIAIKTELSRQTIHKHLKEYKNSIYYAEFQEQFSIMRSRVMTTIFQHAVNGDMRAAKLYLESIGALNSSSLASSTNNVNNNTLIQNQNNYIQIGGAILNQEIIKQMSPEQLSTIEGILKTVTIENESNKI